MLRMTTTKALQQKAQKKNRKQIPKVPWIFQTLLLYRPSSMSLYAGSARWFLLTKIQWCVIRSPSVTSDILLLTRKRQCFERQWATTLVLPAMWLLTGMKHLANTFSRACTKRKQSNKQWEMPKSILDYYLTLSAPLLLTPHLPRSLQLLLITPFLISLACPWSPGQMSCSRPPQAGKLLPPPRLPLLLPPSPHLQRLPQLPAAPQGFQPHYPPRVVQMSLTMS